MRLMATLRRRARLRAAVRSRARLSSSRKVTSRTQWSPFSRVQCRRIAWIRTLGSRTLGSRTLGSSPQLDRKSRLSASTVPEPLTPRMVSTASTVRNPGQARSASRLAASGQANTPRRRTLRAGEHTPTDQAAVAVVEGIEDRPARGAAGETGLLTTRPYRPKRLALIGLEDQQIIRVPVQDPASDRLLAAHWQPMASKVTMQFFKE